MVEYWVVIDGLDARAVVLDGYGVDSLLQHPL